MVRIWRKEVIDLEGKPTDLGKTWEMKRMWKVLPIKRYGETSLESNGV